MAHIHPHWASTASTFWGAIPSSTPSPLSFFRAQRWDLCDSLSLSIITWGTQLLDESTSLILPLVSALENIFLKTLQINKLTYVRTCLMKLGVLSTMKMHSKMLFAIFLCFLLPFHPFSWISISNWVCPLTNTTCPLKLLYGNLQFFPDVAHVLAHNFLPSSNSVAHALSCSSHQATEHPIKPLPDNSSKSSTTSTERSYSSHVARPFQQQ